MCYNLILIYIYNVPGLFLFCTLYFLALHFFLLFKNTFLNNKKNNGLGLFKKVQNKNKGSHTFIRRTPLKKNVFFIWSFFLEVFMKKKKLFKYITASRTRIDIIRLEDDLFTY